MTPQPRRSDRPPRKTRGARSAYLAVTMGIAYVLALFLIIVGLKNEELYGKEAALWGGLSVVTFVGLLLLPRNYWALAIVPQVLIDVVLLVKVFGGDIAIR